MLPSSTLFMVASFPLILLYAAAASVTKKMGFYDIDTLQSDFNPELAGAVFFRGAAVGHDGVEVQPRQDCHVRLPRRPQVVDQAQGKFELRSNVIKTFFSFVADALPK